MKSSREPLQPKIFLWRHFLEWLTKPFVDLSTWETCEFSDLYILKNVMYPLDVSVHILWLIMFIFCPLISRYSLGVSQEEMKQELQDYLPSLEHWAKEYLSSPTPKSISLKMCVDTHTHTHSLNKICSHKLISYQSINLIFSARILY